MHVPSHIPDETLQSTAAKFAGLIQQIMENLLRVREFFQFLRVGHTQRPPTLRISRGLPQRRFIDQQPRFLHPHRNHANHRWSVNRALLQGLANFIHTFLDRFPLGIPVHEEQIARIQLDTPGDALEKSKRGVLEPTQIRELRLNGDTTEVLS